MRLHVRDWAVNGSLDLVTAHASLFGYRRSVDCEAMCFARAPATMVEVLAAQCQSSTYWGRCVVGSNLEPERDFCRTLRKDTSEIVAGSGLACAIRGGSEDGW